MCVTDITRFMLGILPDLCKINYRICFRDIIRLKILVVVLLPA